MLYLIGKVIFYIQFDLKRPQNMALKPPFSLSKAIKTQQNRLLNSRHCLSSLFDKIQTKSVFSVPQNSVVINLDNITFGPHRYTITLDNNEKTYFQIIYYCILYYIFEQTQDSASNQAYEKLISYIIQHQIILDPTFKNFQPEEVKAYLIKFLHLLASEKHRRKIVIQELNNLPQINLLFLQLVRQIATFDELKFQKNARIIEQNIERFLGIRFDLLSYEMILFGKQYQVEMRPFDSSLEFAVFKEKQENIDKIRNQFYMGESAHFQEENGKQLLCSNQENPNYRRLMMKRSSRIIKKSTIKSIEMAQSQNFEEKDDGLLQNNLLFQNNLSFVFNMPNIDFDFKIKDSEQTNIQNTLDEKIVKPLNFNQIIQAEAKDQKQDEALPSTVRSTLFNTVDLEERQASTLPDNFFSPVREHKQSLQINRFSLLKYNLQGLSTSHSAKCINTDSFGLKKNHEDRRKRRVPTFILNRQKLKNEKVKQNSQKQLSSTSSSKKIVGNIKITFSYQRS